MSVDYIEAAKNLTKKLVAENGGEIRAVVLFGSVARGESRTDSDIDILIIGDTDFASRQRIHEISYEVDLENRAFTQIIFFSPDGFELEATANSFFVQDVLKQGIVLYDDGTYGRIREASHRRLTRVP